MLERIAVALQGEHSPEQLLQLAKSVSSVLNLEDPDQNSEQLLGMDMRWKVLETASLIPSAGVSMVSMKPLGVGWGQGSWTSGEAFSVSKWLLSSPTLILPVRDIQ